MRFQRLSQSALNYTDTQSHFRKWAAHIHLGTLRTCHSIATSISQLFRRTKEHIGRAVHRIENAAAARLQSLWRRHLKRKEFVLIKRSLEFFQVLLRQKLTKGKRCIELAASVVIQKTWRSFWAQMYLQLTLMDITAIQRLARGKITENRNRKIRQGLKSLRRALRGYIATRRCDRMLRLTKAFVLYHRSAVILQVRLCSLSEQHASTLSNAADTNYWSFHS